MNILKEIFFDASYFYDETGFDLLRKTKTYLSLKNYKFIRDDKEQSYQTYGKKEYKLWKLIEVYNNQVSSVYFTRRGISEVNVKELISIHERIAISKSMQLILEEGGKKHYENKNFGAYLEIGGFKYGNCLCIRDLANQIP